MNELGEKNELFGFKESTSGEVVEAQSVIKMLPNCSPMSQEQIETLTFKI